MGRRENNTSFNRNTPLEKKDFAKEKDIKKKKESVIIACEDSDSSVTYFQCIVNNLIKEKAIIQDSFVVAKHKHTDPKGVLDDLIAYDNDGRTYKDFDHKWIVIDRDYPRVNGGGHTKENFNNALIEAKKKNINVAYSNDSFELWYLLHFSYRVTSILRDDLVKEVINHLKSRNAKVFNKIDSDAIKNREYAKKIYDELYLLQNTAIKNAKQLLAYYGGSHNPESDNPSTTVHELVILLNTFLES